MKEVAEITTKHLSGAVEILAAIVIAISLLKFLYKYVINIFSVNDGAANSSHAHTIWKFTHCSA